MGFIRDKLERKFLPILYGEEKSLVILVVVTLVGCSEVDAKSVVVSIEEGMKLVVYLKVYAAVVVSFASAVVVIVVVVAEEVGVKEVVVVRVVDLATKRFNLRIEN